MKKLENVKLDALTVIEKKPQNNSIFGKKNFMNNELTQKLFEKYPLLYADKDKSNQISLMGYGFAVGDRMV